MKCELINFEHRQNGMALYILPETDVERKLLEGLWKHGALETSNGIADRSPQGFCVQWILDKPTPETT